jgi:hypothetical protein
MGPSLQELGRHETYAHHLLRARIDIPTSCPGKTSLSHRHLLSHEDKGMVAKILFRTES